MGRVSFFAALICFGLPFVGCATGTDDSIENGGGVAGMGGGSGATDGGATGGSGGGGFGGSSGFGGTGGGGFGGTGGGFGGAAGSAGTGAGGSGGLGASGGSGGSVGGTGGATGGTGGATGGTGGATGGTGGATGGTGGATGGTGGATGGSGGLGGSGGCPGTIIGTTCVYMANKTGLSKSAAQSTCTGLGSGWDLCPSTTLCTPSVLSYLSTAGCDCNGGASACACGTTNNLYIHVSDDPAPYYIRTSLVPNCNWTSDACTDSVSETCGSALCCR